VAVAAAPPLPGAMTGLIGLAERVSLAGGTLEHGVDPDGAFVLRASLPR
jgi:signal transduction histidine kinase